ncbi:MAG: bifunctional phosphopantothenoylcysteine decarboxylase/phosphopantothenate--cysteine ligase CoaBC [Bosea sp.]|jgi:phosphopantothenoylcysteine decarboxylase/phosphopantothenate--cysteine ligase|nr:bifunctional phosphopantothenoylcysteine decarboxylase/phosphopantothenate--cysteine ligase CoaBC [Bosea sp. (in: a-proteobacteria)]
MLHGKTILIIIGGGIAAYKSLELIREVKKRGGHVRTILTRAGAQFVTPLSIAALSGEKVHDDLFSLTDEVQMGHIQLSRAADLVVAAPATADLIARMAGGQASDLAATALLATDKRVLIAPAMNVRMWLHPATQRNLATLVADGVSVVGPNEGDMACGEYGPGRMAEPSEIVAAIEAMLAPEARPLSGRHVLVTSGPTHEPIDPVRYIANRSSGKQGHAIAEAAARAGAQVTLISGPVTLGDPAGVTTVHVETANEMLAAVEAALPADIAIFAAAVADWRVQNSAGRKLKKDRGEAPSLVLTPNPDILAIIAQQGAGRPPLVIGFAAETEAVIDNARAKLARKGCDLIVANDVSLSGSGIAGGVMGGDANAVHLVSAAGVTSWPILSKDEVARRLVLHMATLDPRAT